MGLDSTLLKRTYTHKDNIDSILEKVAYWRKATFLHRWIVNNVQNKIDNCAIYYISFNNIKQLLDLCKKDLEYITSFENPEDADEYKIHLQTAVYDEWHINSLKYTIEILSNIVKKGITNNCSYYYESSW